MTKNTIILGRTKVRAIEVTNRQLNWLENIICEAEVLNNERLCLFLPDGKTITTSVIKETHLTQPIWIVETNNSRYTFELL